MKARQKLRFGVEDALQALGQGFIEHRDNQALRDALCSGTLTRQEYFQQLVRLVYRILFLLTAEERGLLHTPEATGEAKARYAQAYAMRRLRERAVGPSACEESSSDLWEGLTRVVRGLEKGEPLLGLPALAGIFSAVQCHWLDGAKLENPRLLTAVFRLSWIREDSGLSRVNWRDMSPEELGSVYESLLELVPQVADNGREFRFANAAESKGNARKTSGSYYTPDSLVQLLLDSALEPVVQRTLAENPRNPVEALLQLAIVDPACGSGHFLLAAARRLAAHVARLGTNGAPSAEQYRQALRQVVGRCIFGVDLNPMAVELCKVALWLEAAEPGRPLSFLDAQLQQGNALLGATPALMAAGIPDDAWSPLAGDNRKTAAVLRKRNKVAGAAGQAEASARASEAALRAPKQVADAWCAAFVWPKNGLPDPLAEAAPTNEVWRQLRDEPQRVAPRTTEEVERLARQYAFFHWHLGFPQVFAKGGFDVVLGNPPWERVKLQEQEFFASRSEEIAHAGNAAARKKLIATLQERNPSLWREWCEASRQAEGQRHFVRSSGRYPLCGKGDINTYALFAEHNRWLLSPRGRAGFICPQGLATDDTTKGYFQALTSTASLASLYEFENEAFLFPDIDHRVRFIVITLAGAAGLQELADLCFANRQVSDLAEHSRHFRLSPVDFATLNPNTKTCPTFRSRRDAELSLALYRRAGVLWREDDAENGNPWRLRFMAVLHMANDSGLFKTRAELEASTSESGDFLPLVEAKMVHHFDHRFGTYEGQTEAQENQGKLPELDAAAHADPHRLSQPYYWVASREVADRLEGAWDRGWLLGWRDIARSTDRRTLLASLLPRAAVGHTFPLLMPGVEPRVVAALYANLCSFALDYATRQKVGGTHLTYHTLKQLPVLPPAAYQACASWSGHDTVCSWLLARVLELTYTAWDLQAFAQDVGYTGPPFRWDADRRFLLRCELDAAFFHLYGISRGDAAYVLETFTIVKRSEEQAHGEYRTQRVILEVYDAMKEAARTGTPYPTRLEPPPADARVAHPGTS